MEAARGDNGDNEPPGHPHRDDEMTGWDPSGEKSQRWPRAASNEVFHQKEHDRGRCAVFRKLVALALLCWCVLVCLYHQSVALFCAPRANRPDCCPFVAFLSLTVSIVAFFCDLKRCVAHVRCLALLVFAAKQQGGGTPNQKTKNKKQNRKAQNHKHACCELLACAPKALDLLGCHCLRVFLVCVKLLAEVATTLDTAVKEGGATPVAVPQKPKNPKNGIILNPKIVESRDVSPVAQEQAVACTRSCCERDCVVCSKLLVKLDSACSVATFAEELFELVLRAVPDLSLNEPCGGAAVLESCKAHFVELDVQLFFDVFWPKNLEDAPVRARDKEACEGTILPELLVKREELECELCALSLRGESSVVVCVCETSCPEILDEDAVQEGTLEQVLQTKIIPSWQFLRCFEVWQQTVLTKCLSLTKDQPVSATKVVQVRHAHECPRTVILTVCLCLAIAAEDQDRVRSSKEWSFLLCVLLQISITSIAVWEALKAWLRAVSRQAEDLLRPRRQAPETVELFIPEQPEDLYEAPDLDEAPRRRSPKVAQQAHDVEPQGRPIAFAFADDEVQVFVPGPAIAHANPPEPMLRALVDAQPRGPFSSEAPTARLPTCSTLRPQGRLARPHAAANYEREMRRPRTSS